MTRLFFIIFGICLILVSTISLVQGKPGYANFWGGFVFAPIAIVIGIGLVLVGIFFSKVFSDDKYPNHRKRYKSKNQ